MSTMSATYPVQIARQRGLSLIELLVALAIGSFLIIGAVTVQSQTRRTFDVNEAQARLQETARYVIAAMEPDLQLAGLYGFSQDPNVVMYLQGGTLTPPSQMRTTKTAVSGFPTLNSCGANFAIDVVGTVVSENGTYTLACAAQGGGHLGTTDTLTIRHAATVTAVPSVARLQVYSNRLSPHSSTRLFVSSTPPEPLVANVREVRNMVLQSYYVATNSDSRPGVPALRVKTLDSVGGVPDFVDQELVRGVEDLQVQFGVDPGDDTDGDGVPDDPGGDGMADFVNGLAAQYVNAGNPLVDSGQIVAVRVWVRVRGDTPESGFVDAHRYRYADVDFTPNDGFRRVLLSRTIFLRNARQQ
jgi:type IV pilus assembly protein PilW